MYFADPNAVYLGAVQGGEMARGLGVEQDRRDLENQRGFYAGLQTPQYPAPDMNNLPTAPVAQVAPPPVQDPVVTSTQGGTGQIAPAQTGSGLQLPNYTVGDPGGSKIGRSGALGVPQINSDSPQLVQDVTGFAARTITKDKLDSIRYGMSLGAGRYGPGYGAGRDYATNPIAQVWGYATDNPQERAARAAQTEAVDWYDSEEASNYFSQNPLELDKAIKNPTEYYQGLKGGTVVVPPQAAATQQGAGVTPPKATTKAQTTGAGETRQAGGLPSPKTAPVSNEMVKPLEARSKVAPFVPAQEWGREMQKLTDDRQYLVARLQRAAGMNAYGEINQVNAELKAHDDMMYHMVGQKAVTMLEAGDPSLLSYMYQQSTGKPYIWQTRSDGKLNLLLGGQPVQEGVEVSDLSKRVRFAQDNKYAEGVKQAQTAYATDVAKEREKSALKIQEIAATGTYKLLEAQYGKPEFFKDDSGGVYAGFPGNKIIRMDMVTTTDADGTPVPTVKTTQVDTMPPGAMPMGTPLSQQ